MDLIEWSSDLQFGYEPIDKERQKVVTSLKFIHSKRTDRSTAPELASLFHALVVNIEEYFEAEEAWFAEVYYPRRSEHVVSHQKLVVELLKLDWEISTNKSELCLLTLEHVAALLTDHFKGPDQRFTDFYRKSADRN